jgi:GABA(A) receptor-associated protein
MEFKFKKDHSLEKRRNEALRILSKYPDRIPVIIEKNPKNDIPDIDKHKYLVPKDLTVGQFIYIIRKRIKLNAEQGIFLFVNNELPTVSITMNEIYERYKDSDNFVYFLFSSESVYG